MPFPSLGRSSLKSQHLAGCHSFKYPSENEEIRSVRSETRSAPNLSLNPHRDCARINDRILFAGPRSFPRKLPSNQDLVVQRQTSATSDSTFNRAFSFSRDFKRLA